MYDTIQAFYDACGGVNLSKSLSKGFDLDQVFKIILAV